jgi:hypothetical protein
LKAHAKRRFLCPPELSEVEVIISVVGGTVGGAVVGVVATAGVVVSS